MARSKSATSQPFVRVKRRSTFVPSNVPVAGSGSTKRMLVMDVPWGVTTNGALPPPSPGPSGATNSVRRSARAAVGKPKKTFEAKQLPKELKEKVAAAGVAAVADGEVDDGGDDQRERLATVLHVTAQCVTDCNLLLAPFLPTSANAVDRVLGGSGEIAPMPRIEEVDDLTTGSFEEVLDDASVSDKSSVKRIVVCSGKVYYDLLAYQRDKAITDVAQAASREPRSRSPIARPRTSFPSSRCSRRDR